MINQLVLTGDLGNEPEIFFSQGGDLVTTFSMAFKSGCEKVNWMKSDCINKNAEVAEKYLHSGACVAVVGYQDLTIDDANRIQSMSQAALKLKNGEGTLLGSECQTCRPSPR